MLDYRSLGTFVNSELTKKLRTEGTITIIKIKTLKGDESKEIEAISDLKVTNSTGKNVSYARKNLPVRDEDITTPHKTKDWKYLETIAY